MKIPPHPRHLGWLLFCVASVWIRPEPVQGQPAQPDEVKAIVRISKQLIDEVVARRDIVANIPYNAIVLGFECQGVIHGRGKLSVELTSDVDDAEFVVNSQGTAHTCARGVRGPLVAIGPGWGPFASRTLVRFDGKNFSRGETTPWAEVHGELQRVEGRRGGPVGRAVGRMVRPLGQLLVPRAEEEATPIGEHYLKNFVDETADKIISRLNRVTPVEKSLNRVFPETKDWVYQLSTNSHYIQAAYGPPGSKVPTLPASPNRLENAGIELWLQSTTEEAKALEKLSKTPLAKQLVQRYLEATLPELAAVAEERQVAAIGPWVVIGIGLPKSLPSAQEKSP